MLRDPKQSDERYNDYVKKTDFIYSKMLLPESIESKLDNLMAEYKAEMNAYALWI